MTLFFRSNTKIKRIITLILLIFFGLSSFAGAEEPMLCIDQEEIHLLIPESLSLEPCHSVSPLVDAGKVAEEHAVPDCGCDAEGECVDILSNSHLASLASCQVTKLLSKAVLSVALISQPATLSQELVPVPSGIDVHDYPPPSSHRALQTVVLLI